MTARLDNPPPETLASTGMQGLDDVLAGGLTPNRLYLLEGVPGSGKTTLAMQFLMAGVRRGEPVLYVTLVESEDEMRGVVASHGWSLEGITVERTIRDFTMESGGIHTGPPLRDFRGVLTGMPMHEKVGDNLRAGHRP